MHRPSMLGKFAGIARAIALCVLLGAIAIALIDNYVLGGLLWDSWRNPWAHSWRGQPALVGTWYGELVSPNGAHRMLYLDMHRSVVNRTKRRSFGTKYSTCAGCPRIEGNALFADQQGQIQQYEIWGGPDNWEGTRFHLNGMRIVGQELPGLTPEDLRNCSWSGNELRCQMVFGYFNGQGNIWSSDDPEVNTPIQITFKRGTEAEFRAASKQLASQKTH